MFSKFTLLFSAFTFPVFFIHFPFSLLLLYYLYLLSSSLFSFSVFIFFRCFLWLYKFRLFNFLFFFSFHGIPLSVFASFLSFSVSPFCLHLLLCSLRPSLLFLSLRSLSAISSQYSTLCHCGLLDDSNLSLATTSGHNKRTSAELTTRIRLPRNSGVNIVYRRS